MSAPLDHRSRSRSGNQCTAAWERPFFSVVIPTYQRCNVICDALRALARVTYAGRFEVVVVVDGSNDGTAAVLAELDFPFPLNVVEQENHGAAAARNRGAQVAKGEILLFLDDDMICEPNLIEQHSRIYRDGADAVTGEVCLHPSSPVNFITESVDRWIKLPRPEVPQLPFHVYTGQLSVRRSVFEDIGGFDAAFTCDGLFGHEDTDFGMKLISRYRLRHSREALTGQRYLIGPRESMERVKAMAAADVRFLAKYPQFTDYITTQRGRQQWKTRFFYLPLSKLPFVTSLMAKLAVALAEACVKTRFHSNRLMRYFFFAARTANYWSAVRKRGGYPSSQSLLILCYHAIKDQSGDPLLSPYGVSPERFSAQLDSLARRAFNFIDPDALAAFLRDRAPLPRRAILLTFDDCYEDLLHVVRKVLRPRHIPAVAFMVTGTPSGTNEWDQAEGARAIRLLTPMELRELRSLGIEIGAHSRTHPLMPQLTPSELQREASGASEDLISAGLPPPRFFAYPYGATNAHVIEAVRSAGYLAALGVRTRRVDRKSDLLDLPRVPVLSSDSAWRFYLKTAAPSLFDWVDINLFRLSRALGRAAPAHLA